MLEDNDKEQSTMTERKDLPIELKEISENGTFEGYGSMFGNVDAYGDVVEAGAFKRTLKNRNSPVKLLWQHNPDNPIGVFDEVREDEKGLFVKGRLAIDTQQGREAHSLLRMGAVDGLSIGFRTIKEKFKDGVRLLKEIKLYEVSLVTFPANEAATVNNVKNEELKSVFDELPEDKKREALAIMRSMSLDPATGSDDDDADELNDLLHGVEEILGKSSDTTIEDHSAQDELDTTGSEEDSLDEHSLEQVCNYINQEDELQ